MLGSSSIQQQPLLGSSMPQQQPVLGGSRWGGDFSVLRGLRALLVEDNLINQTVARKVGARVEG